MVGAMSAGADPESYESAIAAARDKYCKREWAGALLDLRQALRVSENDAERAVAYLHMGNCHRASHDHQQALTAFEQVLKLKTVSANHVYQAQMGIESAAVRLNDEARARQACQEVVDDAGMAPPYHCTAWLRMAESHAREDQHEKAQQAIIQALGIDDVPLQLRVQSIMQLGNCFYTQSKYANAREAYESVLVMEGVPPDQLALAQHRIGLTWFSENDYDKARKALLAATEMPDNRRSLAESILYLGLIHVRRDENDLARAQLEKIANIKGAAKWHVRTAHSQLEQLEKRASGESTEPNVP